LKKTDRTTIAVDLPICTDCDRAHWPPMEHCPHCLGGQVRTESHSTEGTVLAVAELHRSLDEAFHRRLPWRVDLVHLHEGVTIISSNVSGVAEALPTD
jgi:uncharacterized OB-fold protein